MYSNKLILVALAATVTVSESACTNDKKWMINNKRSKNCDWVAKKPSSRCQKKGKNGKGNKVEANVACQESCGTCDTCAPDSWSKKCVTAGMCANEFDLHEPAPTFFERVATFPVCSQIDGACDDETETSAEIVDVHVKACVASWSSAIDGAACAAGVDACPAAPCDGDALGSWCCADADCSGDWFYCNPKAGGQLTAVYTDSPRGVIGWVDLNDPRDPKPLGTFATPGEPTSVAVVGDAAVVAVSTGEDYVATPTPSPRAPCAFAGDTAYIAVAIENERDEDLGDGNPPQFPAGHVEIFTAKTANSELGLPADGSAPIPFAALSSLTAEAGDLVLAVEDSAYGKSRVFEIDVGVAPPSSSAYVVAHEGYGTVGDAGRPVRSLNFLFVLGLSGPDYVIDKVIALPDAQNARQLRFGFEGVAVLDNKIVVAFQRAWGADEFPQMGVYDYAVGGDAGWSFVFYPVDEPSSQYGGWVGVGDIEAAPVQTGGAVGDISRLARAPIMNAGIVLIIAASTLARAAGAQPVSCADPEDGSVASRFVRNTCTANAFDMAVHTIPDLVPLIRRTMCGPARLDDRVSLYKMGLADSFPGPKMCIWSTNDEINRGALTPYARRRDFGQDTAARRVDPCQIYFEYQHDATVESGVDRHELFERLTRAGYKLNDFMKNEEVGSFTPEQWDGMRGGDLRAVLDDASCGCDDAPVACGCGLDGDWPEAPSKAPPDWLRVPRQSSAWAVTMVLALPACRGAPARSLREASACGPRDACVFDALKRSGDRGASHPFPAQVLNGHRCDRHVDVGDADAAGAVARVGALGFVGVADDWATSVCLFHRVTACRARRAQLAEPPPPGNATDDWADWAVYAAARRRFAELLDAAGASPACAPPARGGGGAARAARGDARRLRRRRPRVRCRGGPRTSFRPVEALGLPRGGALGGPRRRGGVDAAFAAPADPLRRAARATIAGGRLFATLPADGALAMAYSRAEWNRLPVFLGAFLEIARRFPALPPVDFLFLLMDVPGVLDASTSPPVFAEARLRRAPPDRRHWLLPSFDTFRLEAATRLDGRGHVVDALAEPVAASLQFSGGEGNARRWAVTTACDATDDRLDVAAAEVAVEVEARGATDRAVSGDPAAAAARAVAAADGPTGITLRNYGFADHGDVCAKEAFLYLDGISTSNGLKYYGACGAPVILDERAAYEDLVTAAWPAHAAAAHDPGATLRDKVDYVGADGAGAAAFCASVARAVAWLRAHAADAKAMGARTRGAMLAVGSARGARRLPQPRRPRRGAPRARVGARLRVLAAVKGRCWARADAADAAVAASATVRAARLRLWAARQTAALYSDDAPAPRTAAQDVYAALRPCADLDCGGGLADLGAGGGPRGSLENPTRCCKVAGDDGAAARDACREACCRPAKPGKG
ncbi:hypothetical protein JL722_9106 [Aureococcus anophagefferens]|nr:hypothetical protein JL722_9106 [Aureococcus anophagefferens]